MEIENLREEVFKQYEEIRKSGVTNMFDLKKVTEISEDNDFTALLEAIDERQYGRIMKSYSRAKELGVI